MSSHRWFFTPSLFYLHYKLHKKHWARISIHFPKSLVNNIGKKKKKILSPSEQKTHTSWQREKDLLINNERSLWRKKQREREKSNNDLILLQSITSTDVWGRLALELFSMSTNGRAEGVHCSALLARKSTPGARKESTESASTCSGNLLHCWWQGHGTNYYLHLLQEGGYTYLNSGNVNPPWGNPNLLHFHWQLFY